MNGITIKQIIEDDAGSVPKKVMPRSKDVNHDASRRANIEHNEAYSPPPMPNIIPNCKQPTASNINTCILNIDLTSSNVTSFDNP